MTAGAFPQSPEPYHAKILDFTHYLNVEESVVMTRFDNSLNFKYLHAYDILGDTSFSSIVIMVIFTIIITLMGKSILVNKESICQRFTTVTLSIIGIFLQRCKAIKIE